MSASNNTTKRKAFESLGDYLAYAEALWRGTSTKKSKLTVEKTREFMNVTGTLRETYAPCWFDILPDVAFFEIVDYLLHEKDALGVMLLPQISKKFKEAYDSTEFRRFMERIDDNRDLVFACALAGLLEGDYVAKLEIPLLRAGELVIERSKQGSCIWRYDCLNMTYKSSVTYHFQQLYGVSVEKDCSEASFERTVLALWDLMGNKLGDVAPFDWDHPYIGMNFALDGPNKRESCRRKLSKLLKLDDHHPLWALFRHGVMGDESGTPLEEWEDQEAAKKVQEERAQNVANVRLLMTESVLWGSYTFSLFGCPLDMFLDGSRKDHRRLFRFCKRYAKLAPKVW